MNLEIRVNKNKEYIYSVSSSKNNLYDSHLIKIIFENAGIHYSDIRKISKLSNGTLQRRLKQLEDSKLIKVNLELGRTRYFEKNYSKMDINDMGLLRRPAIKKIIESLIENDKLFFQEIVQKLKKSPSTTSYYISELVTEGIIQRKEEKNRNISYDLKDKQRIKKYFTTEFQQQCSSHTLSHPLKCHFNFSPFHILILCEQMPYHENNNVYKILFLYHSKTTSVPVIIE